MSKLPQSTDVLIVGAGPTGLALANALLDHGIDMQIVDKQAEGANTSRAAAIQARTLEVLKPYGLVPDLFSEAIKVPTFRVRDRDSTLLNIDFTHLETEYPTVLMCPQDRTEVVLNDHLRRKGASVHRPVEFASHSQDGAEVSATLRSGDGEEVVRAKWLVGCDGAHSLVREGAEIPFEGGDFGESFILADVMMDNAPTQEEIQLFFSPAGLLVVAPLPHNRFRIVTTMPDPPEHPRRDDVQELLDARGPEQKKPRITEIIWSTRFRIHHRVATSVRSGRVLLCGDAAHVHSPAGGQGMNTGIQDAMALVDPLIAALRSGRSDRLDEWADNRKRIAQNVVQFTSRITWAATLSSGTARAARNAAMRLLGRIPSVRHGIAFQLAELDNR